MHAYAFYHGARQLYTLPAGLTLSCSRGTRPAFLAALPRMLALPLKALFQAAALLLMMLLWLPPPDALLLQVLQGSHMQWRRLDLW